MVANTNMPGCCARRAAPRTEPGQKVLAARSAQYGDGNGREHDGDDHDDQSHLGNAATRSAHVPGPSWLCLALGECAELGRAGRRVRRCPELTRTDRATG